jgi:hypothetical protein
MVEPLTNSSEGEERKSKSSKSNEKNSAGSNESTNRYIVFGS